MKLRIATWNVLAQAYLGYGDYSHVESNLLNVETRYRRIVEVIAAMDADIIGLQEVDQELSLVLEKFDAYEMSWFKKLGNKPDGCALLVRAGLGKSMVVNHIYHDNTSHVWQKMKIGDVTFYNTHMKWSAATEALRHTGAWQLAEILHDLDEEARAVLLADCNDRPGGPLRKQLDYAKFVNVHGDKPTARVDSKLVALDLLAVRGVNAEPIDIGMKPDDIPSLQCPSDHVPLVAHITL